jgi:hypothetical protein
LGRSAEALGTGPDDRSITAAALVTPALRCHFGASFKQR